MRSITDLLLNHPIPGIRHAEIRHQCADVLTRLLGTEVTPGNVKYASGMLSLSLAPVLKSALILKQKELGEALLGKGIELREVQ